MNPPDWTNCTEEELWRYVAWHLEGAGIRSVLVGGAVVSIYTEGLYRSGDLDMVTDGQREGSTGRLHPLEIAGEFRPGTVDMPAATRAGGLESGGALVWGGGRPGGLRGTRRETSRERVSLSIGQHSRLTSFIKEQTPGGDSVSQGPTFFTPGFLETGMSILVRNLPFSISEMRVSSG